MLGVVLAQEAPKPFPTEDERMEAAVAEARSRVDEFLAALNAGDAERYPQLAVKVAVAEDEVIEHLWLKDVRYEDGHFIGKLNNTPHMITKVKRGDEVKVAKEEISDWIYADSEKRKMVGGFTDKAAEEPVVNLGEHELLGLWVVQDVDGGQGARKQPGTAIQFTRNAVFMVHLEGEAKRSKMADLTRVDPKTAPSQVDFSRGDALGYGAYKLDGDKLTLSMRNPGQKRPTSLKASRGGMVFRLVKAGE